jgi:hypothetical protein
MKRDLDLVRQLMLQIEALPASPPVQYRAGEVEDPVLLKHLEMLIAAGLVSGKISQSHGSRGDVISISGLTWDGYEWVEMVRSQAVWNEIKTTLMERAGAVTFELTRAVARRILLARVGLPAPREPE